MNKLKPKAGCRFIALFMAVLMMVSLLPATAITYAVEKNPYKAKNFTAVYNNKTDSVDLAWDIFETEPAKLVLCVNGTEVEEIFAAASSFSLQMTDGGEAEYSVRAYAEETDSTGVESDRVKVRSAATLASIPAFTVVEVENNMELPEIIRRLPAETAVALEGEADSAGHEVRWNAENVNYDRTVSTEQTINITGLVVLNTEKAQNRKNISLETSITVKVKTADGVVLATDLNDSFVENKKVGESLSLSVAASGTAPAYQWYKKTAEGSSAINGATSATLSFASLTLGDAAQYYCVVTGKTGATVTSKTVTVNVSKIQTAVTLSVEPSAGQARPNSITLAAVGVPEDATGKLIFKEGSNILKEIELTAGADKTVSFAADGDKNEYDFAVIYEAGAENEKYLGSENTITGYSFTKSGQTVSFEENSIPKNITYAKNENFTAQATGGKTGAYEYGIADERDSDGNPSAGSVATIDPKTGKVTILSAGSFRITVKALGNDDYNESEVIKSGEIRVNRAGQESFAFEDGAAKITYSHGFRYTRELSETGKGDGKITYSLGENTTAEGVVINSETGEITFANGEEDNSVKFAGKVGVVEVIATKAADKNYNEITASYTVEILKAEQAEFAFDIAKPDNIIFESGKEYTNVISGKKCGTVKAAPEYSVVKQMSLDGNEISDAVVSVNGETGTITALRSGIVTIKAKLSANGVYEATEAEYTITIERGAVAIAGDNAFQFEEANPSIKYGQIFSNEASGGQEDKNRVVTYSIEADENIKDEISVDEQGAIYFLKKPDKATNDSYTVTVVATKAQTDLYDPCTISYKLSVTRDKVAEKDFQVNEKPIKNEKEWYNAKDGEITITPCRSYDQISKDGTNWSNSIGFEEGTSVSFYLKNSITGITSQCTPQKLNFDKTPATAALRMDQKTFWDSFLETITFGIWKKSDQTITIEANDNLSGIQSIEYVEQVSDFKNVGEDTSVEDIIKEFDENGMWVTCEVNKKGEAKVTLSAKEGENKKSVVYVKVTDVAGNISYFRSNGIVFDTIVPDPSTALTETDIEIQVDENTKKGLYNGEADVPFTLKVTDPQTEGVASGIQVITVSIQRKNGKNAWENYKKFAIEAKHSEICSFDSEEDFTENFEVNKLGATFEDLFTVPKEINSNHIRILVEVKDYAGNTNEKTVSLAIDGTAPEINVSYNGSKITNDSYIGNNQNRVATIHIKELNFDPDKVEIKVTRDGKAVNIVPNFRQKTDEKNKNGDVIGWVMKIDYGTLGEGDYTFDIRCTDRVGNVSNGWNGNKVAANRSFTIDNTKPNIKVSITNNAVMNGKYFASDRTATVTIVERNFSEKYSFDWSGLTLTLDGVAQRAPKPVLVKSDDTTYERVYTIDFSAEGDYTFDVKYTDLAGNKSEGYACSSVAYKKFTIDKTAPTLDITGVANRSANSGDVAPVVSYSDVNFNKDAVSIVLSGINNGAVRYNGAYANTRHGQTYTYANFEKIPQVDDIYTLTAQLTDMAGNKTEKTITFSANRFGSVYDFTDIKDVLSKYLQTEEDIVFTETNVDALDRGSIHVKLIKNGTPTDLVEGTDYTIETVGGSGRWSVYKYTIKKKLFSDDGRYSISIYSKDAAGNVNENIDEAKTADISFGIDKTKPVVTPIDFASGVQYAVDTKTVSVEIKDNLVMGDVKIYLNGTEVNYSVNGETYTFDIPKSNSKQDVKIVAIDAAGNEEPVEITDFLVNTNIFVRWFNNTLLFIGSIIGVVAIGLGVAGFVVFRKKKKEEV